MCLRCLENCYGNINDGAVMESITTIDRFSWYLSVRALHFHRICSNDQRRLEHKVRDRLCEQFLIE